jgi:outer membrane protein TolC/ABC-type uncharacterized transport system substrate-binding protein
MRLAIGTAALTLAVVSVLTPWSAPSAQTRPVVRIGVVVDGEWHRNAEVLQLFRDEIRVLTEDEFDVQFPESKVLGGGWTLSGVRAALDRLLEDPEVDMVLAAGVLASDDACRRGALPKPVVAPAVVDPRLQGLPDKNGASGVKNLCYLNLPSTLRRDVQTFLTIAPFHKLAILVDADITAAIPELGPRAAALLEGIDVEPVSIPVGTSVDALWSALPPDVEAVYVYPLRRLSVEAFSELVSGLIERRLPSFSFLGETGVNAGILVGLNPDIFPRMARRVALDVQRILLGDEPGEIPTAFPAGQRLMINVATARAIGRYPDWAVMTEAVLVNDERPPVSRRVSLESVMEDALTVNLDLAAENQAVASGSQEVKKARSRLLPQVTLSGTGVIIDEDRASPLTQAQRTLSGKAQVTQVLLSDPAFAGYAVERHRQDVREETRNALRLDVVQEAADAFLELLRARTLEEIRREDLTLSRQHLELARVRESVGQSGPSDVYRWESEIATSRRNAITANSLRNVAEIALNRVLNRPLEEPFEVDPIPATSTGALASRAPYLVYFRDKVSFSRFREFMVQEGLDRSPELASLDAGIAAARRGLSSATRAFTLPTVGIVGSVGRVFSEGGAGSEDPGALLGGLLDMDDTTWDVGIQLSYPLVTGGGRLAERWRARDELRRLELERRAAAERIEQRVRTAAHLSGASFAGIRQAVDAAAAASSNLELVSDAYSRGAVSAIDLLDAQNAHIVADQASANAVYDFLLDLIDLQRAVGRFDVLMTPEARDDFQARLRAHMEPEASGESREP